MLQGTSFMTLVSRISHWPTKRWPWLLLGTSALLLELIALYFQYGMALEPCVMCIYQRTAMFGVAIAGYLGSIAPQQWLMRTLAYATWLVSAVWGYIIAYEHVQMQNPDNFLLAMSCDVYPNFPSWFAIHQWLPAVFEARGSCDSIDWQFLGLSMPSWLVVCFAVYAGFAVITLLARLWQKRSI